MRKFISIIVLALTAALVLPASAFAAGGIYASGGGSVTVGQTFTVNVTASGATFNAFEGTISVSGPVSISSFSAGSATWLTEPANGTHFKGMVSSSTSSLRMATIKLRATGTGNGAVSVSAVRLANAGVDVGGGAGSASFSVSRALTPPGGLTVTSDTHPDQNTPYEATTINLAWNKPSGVTAFSYLLDQAEGTTPPAKATSSETAISYADQAIGTYYFHIRAQNADGWGSTTHFKITIKEPDAKIDGALSKPSDIKIEKSDSYSESLKDGTVTGIIISGVTEANYNANIVLTPALTLPEGKTLTAISDADGNFSLLIDYPIKSGVYTLTIQGQQEKILTPVSDQIMFEISLAKGGSITILTDNDLKAPVASSIIKGSFLKNEYPVMIYLIVSLILAILILGSIELIKFIKRRKLNA